MLLLMLALAAGAPEARTPDALREVEARWSRAFVTGDAPTLEALLSPDYVSVSARGVARRKDEIVSVAKRYAAEHPGATPSPPSPDMNVRVEGDTGLVRHASASELSVDVFHYERGHWRAWHSQHTAIAAQP